MKLLLDLQGMQTESRYRGIGRQTKSLALALASRPRDHEIHILLGQRLGDGLSEATALFEPLIGRERIHTFGVPGAVAERDSGNLWRTKAAELIREAAIADIKPDMVHIASLFEGFVDDAVTSIGLFDAPHAVAVTLHDLIPLADPARYLAQESSRLHWLRRAQFLKRADLLLSVSSYTAKDAMERLHIGADRIAIMSAGVDRLFQPANLRETETAALRDRFRLESPFILYVGAVDPRKNVELIFAAFEKLPANQRTGRLLAFAGRLFDDEIGQLKVAAARHNIASSQLRFLQQVTDSDLISLYRLCDVFVFPSKYEGFGLPVLEAMACGAPTLAAAATSLIEVVGNEQYLFDPEDPASLAERLDWMFTDVMRRDEARAYGINRAQHFTWESAAERALDAMEATHAKRIGSNRTLSPLPVKRKPKLAFVSPLPADRSGVADYSAALLPELARFFEIECIVTQDTILSDEWIRANFVLRDVPFFERNAGHYDHILYSVGNSHFHAHMLELMRRFPGVVLLHDFFISDLIDWMSTSGVAPEEDFFRALYKTHGLSGLRVERRDGRRAAIDRYPCNHPIFEAASGVIVHSQYAMDYANALYSDRVKDAITLIPHLRAVPSTRDRSGARKRLGVGDDETLLCAFGILTERKCSRRLIEAWLASNTGKNAKAKLVFVGENLGGEYGDAIERLCKEHPSVSITGYAAPSLYRDYLNAADIAVQLRSQSRGETSGTVLDCLASGVPLIINDHGTLSEISDQIALKIPDQFETEDLSTAIDTLVGDRSYAEAMANRARAHLAEEHHPERIGELFRDAINRFDQHGHQQLERTLRGALAEFVAPVYPDRDDQYRVARVVSTQWPRPATRQILYDVTVLAQQDAHTGIQRVVRSVLTNLIDCPPPGFRIEPIYIDGQQYRYARQWTAKALNLPCWVLPDDPVEYAAGDIYAAIDWVPDRLPDVEGWLSEFRLAGGRVTVGVHDLLPFDLPQHFPDFMPNVTRRWFETALRVADQFVCVSRTVADTVVKYATALMPEKERRRIAIDYFHNAADIASSVPTRGTPDDGEAILSALNARPTFLMVGTVEPRKGHVQVLQGFERLWRDGVDANLVVVGKSGWMMDDLVARLERHVERDQRLFWLPGISDEFLERLYAGSSALIAASEGEGFGLPLIEGARHKLPLIVRDIAVFREVAGDHAFYFSGELPRSISDAVRDWLILNANGSAPRSDDMPFRTWRESTQQFVQCLLANDHYTYAA